MERRGIEPLAVSSASNITPAAGDAVVAVSRRRWLGFYPVYSGRAPPRFWPRGLTVTRAFRQSVTLPWKCRFQISNAAQRVPVASDNQSTNFSRTALLITGLAAEQRRLQ